MTVEEALRQIRDRAAMLRYLAESVALNPALPDVAVMNGVGDVCEQIEDTAQLVADALDMHALSIELRRASQSGDP